MGERNGGEGREGGESAFMKQQGVEKWAIGEKEGLKERKTEKRKNPQKQHWKKARCKNKQEIGWKQHMP